MVLEVSGCKLEWGSGCSQVLRGAAGGGNGPFGGCHWLRHRPLGGLSGTGEQSRQRSPRTLPKVLGTYKRLSNQGSGKRTENPQRSDSEVSRTETRTSTRTEK